MSAINVWWKIVNSKQEFYPNDIVNAITLDDEKVDFLQTFAEWLENWLKNGNASFRFSKQTMQSLIWTLRSQADLLDKLLMNDHKYILTAHLQSDPIERRFSQYRQLNGGHFLVSLREVETSEKILLCQTLLKENINFWEEEPAVTNATQEIEKFKEALDSVSVLIQEATLTAETEEVVQVVSGYIAKQLIEKTKCRQCINALCGSEVEKNSNFEILSRGGLKIPSAVFKDYVAFGFATLDLTNALLQQLTNIFYNNKQKIENSKIRKDVVSTFKKRQPSKC